MRGILEMRQPRGLSPAANRLAGSDANGVGRA